MDISLIFYVILLLSLIILKSLGKGKRLMGFIPGIIYLIYYINCIGSNRGGMEIITDLPDF